MRCFSSQSTVHHARPDLTLESNQRGERVEERKDSHFAAKKTLRGDLDNLGRLWPLMFAAGNLYFFVCMCLRVVSVLVLSGTIASKHVLINRFVPRSCF